MNKKLLFIHNLMPSEGISGMIIFLRHFKRLNGWDIHIAIPENAYRKEIADTYPPNFFVHTFPLRKKYWLPFSFKIPFIAGIRFRQWAGEINKSLHGIEPDIIVSVLAHFFCISAASLSKKLQRPLYLFVHDNWAMSNPVQRKHILKWAKTALEQANTLLPVSKALVSHYGQKFLNKTTLLYPIPNGSEKKAHWKTGMQQQLVLLHAGTADMHIIKFFEEILKNSLQKTDCLTVVYDDYHGLKPLQKYPQYKRIGFFEKSEGLMAYATASASALLVYYGLEESENKFGMDSFPSRFAELSHTGLPIICIAHADSEFYKFLQHENWPLLYSKKNMASLKTDLELLKGQNFWQKCASSTTEMSHKYFNPGTIQQIFLNALAS